MIKAVFLDRDGTINEDVGHITSANKFELIPGSIEAMMKLRKAGYLLPLITNQAGVGRGLMTEHQLRRVLDDFQALLKKEGTYLDGVYYCPHHPEEAIGSYKRNCQCRKPGPEMLQRAARNLGVYLGNSFMIGDHGTDVQAGLAAGCRTILLMTGHGEHEINRLAKEDRERVSFVAKDLAQAVDWILGNETG